MKKRTRNLLLITGGALLSAVLVSGCTKSFCSDKDLSNILFAIDPGVSTYLDASEVAEYTAAIDAKNAELEEGKRYTYIAEQVFDNNPNLYRVIEINSDGYYIQSKNVVVSLLIDEEKNINYVSALEDGRESVVNEGVKSAIEKTVSNGGYVPSLEYYKHFDVNALALAIDTYRAERSGTTITVDNITADQVEEVFFLCGGSKFVDYSKNAGMDFSAYQQIHDLTVTQVGIEAAASKNYIENYKSNMQSQSNSLRSCISTFERDGVTYGNYGPYQTSVPIETKNWGYAWNFGSHGGFFEGLLVYPVAWMIDGFTNLFGGVQAVAIPQLLALIVVTVIVRLAIFGLTFPSTLQQQKMTALQPEIAKLQAKYPNSNTSQVEKQRLAQEQQALYKKYKVHPLLQLLVMVIQFPVFICVWGAMQGSAVLSTGQILGLHLSSSIMSVVTNFAGWPGNPAWWTAIGLFIIMSGSQFLSMKLPQWIQKARAKKVAKLGVNPAQKQQNRTMNIISYVMLAVIIVMGFTLPAAMGVYWFVGAIVSLAQSFVTQAIANSTLRKMKKNRK